MRPAPRRRSPPLAAAGRVLLLSLLLDAAPAQAALSTEELAERIGVGNPARGAAKGETAGCLNCHGSGAPASIGTPVPRLAGQLAGYTLAQIERFKTGQRRHPQIARDAGTPSIPDAEDIAAWFASSAPTPASDAAAAVMTERGADSARLFTQGDRSRDVIACVSCHGADGRGLITGSDSTPAIGGQSADYLRARLRTWRAGAPAGTPISVMNLVARSLADSEIDALAAWLSQLPPAP